MSLAAKSTSILKRDIFLYATRIFTSAIIARKLGPEMLGIAVILTLIPSYAEAFGRLKFDAAAVYFLGKRTYLISDVVWTLNLLALFTSGLIVAFFLWQFAWLYGLLFSRSSLDVASLVYLVLLSIPLHFLWMNYSYLLLHREDIATYNRMIIIEALVSSMLAITLLFLTELGLWAVVGSSVLAKLLSLVYGAARLGIPAHGGTLLNMPLIRDLFQYGSKLYAGGLVGQLQAYLTNLLVAIFLVPAQVAFFSLARGLGQMIDRVPAALNTILFPRLTKIDDRREAAELAARAFRYLAVLLLVVGVLAATLVYPAVYILYGADYLPLVRPFLILIPGILAAGATTPFMQYFMSINRADLGITLPILPLMLQVATALWLIPSLGPEGAAIAFSGSLIVFALISVWMFVKLSNTVTWIDFMIRRDDLRYLQNHIARQFATLMTASRLKKARASHAE